MEIVDIYIAVDGRIIATSHSDRYLERNSPDDHNCTGLDLILSLAGLSELSLAHLPRSKMSSAVVSDIYQPCAQRHALRQPRTIKVGTCKASP